MENLESIEQYAQDELEYDASQQHRGYQVDDDEYSTAARYNEEDYYPDDRYDEDEIGGEE